MLNFRTKTIVAFVAILLAAHAVFAGETKLPIDSATGKICYKFTVEFDKSYKTQAIYAIAREWFNQNPALFTRANEAGMVKSQADERKNENRDAVMHEFNNANPLQFTDPESDRLSGKVIMKYQGNNNGCIRLLYLQYSLIITVKDHKLYGEISNIVYNHFNPRNYQPQPVFNWSGMMPCDQVNTLEYLRDCQACPVEFNGFYSFINSDMSELINSFHDFLKANKGVAIVSAN